MQDDEYRAAWQEEERKRSSELLAEWRKHDNLTKRRLLNAWGYTSGYFPPGKQHHQSQHRHSDPLRSRLRHQKPVIALY